MFFFEIIKNQVKFLLILVFLIFFDYFSSNLFFNRNIYFLSLFFSEKIIKKILNC